MLVYKLPNAQPAGGAGSWGFEALLESVLGQLGSPAPAETTAVIEAMAAAGHRDAALWDDLAGLALQQWYRYSPGASVGVLRRSTNSICCRKRHITHPKMLCTAAIVFACVSCSACGHKRNPLFTRSLCTLALESCRR